jgi:hypothetical protein
MDIDYSLSAVPVAEGRMHLFHLCLALLVDKIAKL